MTTPDLTPEQRLAILESKMDQAQTVLADLIRQADQFRERHTLLEEELVKGLAGLQRALDGVNARRPPVRRKLQEVEERLDQAGIPPTPEPSREDPTP